MVNSPDAPALVAFYERYFGLRLSDWLEGHAPLWGPGRHSSGDNVYSYAAGVRAVGARAGLKSFAV